MAECDWEWGGVPETVPEPCTTSSFVQITGQPLEVFFPLPVAVEEVSPVSPGSTTVDTEELKAITSLGLGLILFFVILQTIWAWRGRTSE